MEQNKTLFLNRKNITSLRPNILVAKNFFAPKNDLPYKEFALSFSSEDEPTIKSSNVLIFLVKSGFITASTKTDTLVAKAGSILIINPGCDFSLEFDCDETFSCSFVEANNIMITGFKNGYASPSEATVTQTMASYSDIENYFTLLATEFNINQDINIEIAKGLLTNIILKALQLSSNNKEVEFSTSNTFLSAKNYIDTNFASIIALQDVCAKLGINKYYLSNIFDAEIRTTPIKYLNTVRVNHARHLLQTTELNIYEVAEACGYSESAYFCKVFKSLVSVTPLAYRYNFKLENK